MKSRLSLLFVVILPLFLLVGLQSLLADDAVVGDGTPASCTEAAFDGALAVAHSGGGLITFNCGGTAVITFTVEKAISADIIIDGNDEITLSGGDSTRIISNSANLTMRNITLTNGFAGIYRGGAIFNSANLTLDSVSILNSVAHHGGGIYNAPFSTATLTNVTLSDNSTDTADYVGGGIFNHSSTLTLTNVTLNGNWAGSGGGIYNGSSSMATLTNVIFSDNSARQNGGGIDNAIDSTITLTHVTFNNNSAEWGGGLHLYYFSVATLTDVLFSDNFANIGGGGILNSSSTATITDVTLIDNSANYGGGIANFSSVVTLTNATLGDNIAGSYGGGIFNNHSTATLTNVTLSGNLTHDLGGGIYNFNHSMAMLTNVTLNGNSAHGLGGGIYNYNDSTAMLTNVTLNGNSALIEGGGIFNAPAHNAHLTLKNSIVANSTSGGNCSGQAADEVLFSLWDDNSCSYITGSGNQPNTDPLLGPLADNGGPTLTHMPLPGSPAIDMGTADGAPTTDQRGLPRPYGCGYDIGAVEVQPVNLFCLYLPVVIKP